MDLNDFLGPNPIVVDLEAKDRWGAIDELMASLVTNHKSVKKRERSMTTGIGFGIGIPHASTDLTGEVVGAIGRSRKGVQFDALDGKLVKVVLLFLVPQGQFQKHLRTLAELAKLLQNKYFRDWFDGQ
jgi:mannitol/fructose-specific phosphotransferase system IIA component (Ntr-type)